VITAQLDLSLTDYAGRLRDILGRRFQTPYSGTAVIDFVLNCASFVYIGAWLPFRSFYMPELGITPPRLVILCIAILFARRIPALLMLYKWIPEIRNWREALFTGHFGPMGVAAVFVSTFALQKLPSPKYPPETQQD